MFLSESIDLVRAEKYILTIRITPDGFAFLVQDTEDKNNFDYQETLFSNKVSLNNNIQRIIFDNSFLTEGFSKTNVLFVSSDYELVPEMFYSKEGISSLYKFTHADNVEHLLSNNLLQQKCVSVFEVDEELYLFLRRSLCNPEFYHYTYPLLDYFTQESSVYQRNKVFVYFHSSFTDILLYNKSAQLLNIHTYEGEQSADIVYYILNVWDKCKFHQFKDHLILYGDTHPEIEVILKEYIKNIHLATVDDNRIIMDGNKKLPLDLALISK